VSGGVLPGGLRYISWSDGGLDAAELRGLEAAQLRQAGATGRALAGRLLQWDKPHLVRNTGQEPFYEWFPQGSVRMRPGRPPGLWLNHSTDPNGHRVGHVEALYDSAMGPETLLLVDEGPLGDVVLNQLGSDGGHVPLSLGFEAITTVRDDQSFPPGLRRTAVWLREVAIVETPAFPEAYVWARGEPAAMRQALEGVGRRRYL
jgi:hypothetical protein